MEKCCRAVVCGGAAATTMSMEEEAYKGNFEGELRRQWGAVELRCSRAKDAR